MFNLGNLEREQGQIGQARRWYQAAIESGHADQTPKAMFNLGSLEEAAGLELLARQWFERAISTSHPDASPLAMIALGQLVEERNPDQARQLYRDAIDTNHGPAARVRLGRLEARHGQVALGKSWLQAAIDTSDPKASRDAQRELSRIATSEDEQRVQPWAQYGYQSRQHLDRDSD